MWRGRGAWACDPSGVKARRGAHLRRRRSGVGGWVRVLPRARVARLWKIMGENTKIMGQIIGDLFEKIDPQREKHRSTKGEK